MELKDVMENNVEKGIKSSDSGITITWTKEYPNFLGLYKKISFLLNYIQNMAIDGHWLLVKFKAGINIK